MQLSAPGATVPATPSPSHQLMDYFSNEEGFKLRLVTRDGEQYLVYKSYKGWENYYGDVLVYRVVGDSLELAWNYHYDAEDGEGFDDGEIGPGADLNAFLDERADALFEAACEDPLAMMTQVLL